MKEVKPTAPVTKGQKMALEEMSGFTNFFLGQFCKR
ncbi:hypothetical protein SAMN05518846_10386 [Brevibacillus centrosporus]|uniref:Uncharacterized protein n=1 Tax=Brevibacillus centrosporus TaxID=54910 RepID=A0A1I3QKZ0_9BACL|nr:hypothetical protein SAMN05518846_10386 [Brevibacillus centrosporus]